MKIFYIIGLLSAISLRAQIQDSLSATISSVTTVGTDGRPTHWLYSNQWGAINPFGNGTLISPKIAYDIRFTDWLDFGVNLQSAHYLPWDNQILEGYTQIGLWDIDIWAGRKRYTIGALDEELGSGSFFLGRNAIPDWSAGIAVHEWSDFPFTSGYLRVKGGLTHKWPMNMSDALNPLLHEKWAYISSGRLPVNISAGVAHMAYYGGIQPSGTPIPNDYLRVFFARGAAESSGFRGEEVNVLGGHWGIIEVSAETDMSGYHIKGSWQKMINDRISFADGFKRNKDNIFGLTIETPGNLVKKIHVEYIYTTVQNGEGIPDPIAPDGSFQAVPLWEDDVEGFLLTYFDAAYLEENYGLVPGSSLTTVDALLVLEQEWNNGFKYGGRSDYLNKYLYQEGFTNFSQPLGNPFMLTRPMWNALTDTTALFGNEFVVNNRIILLHMGLSGTLPKQINYRFMTSFSRNFGNFRGKYRGRFNWPSPESIADYDYPFSDGLDQFNGYLYLEKELSQLPLKVGTAIGADLGEINNNLGIQFSLVYELY